jgi:hypothetical protein
MSAATPGESGLVRSAVTRVLGADLPAASLRTKSTNTLLRAMPIGRSRPGSPRVVSVGTTTSRSRTAAHRDRRPASCRAGAARPARSCQRQSRAQHALHGHGSLALLSGAAGKTEPWATWRQRLGGRVLIKRICVVDLARGGRCHR